MKEHLLNGTLLPSSIKTVWYFGGSEIFEKGERKWHIPYACVSCPFLVFSGSVTNVKLLSKRGENSWFKDQANLSG